MVRKQPPHFNHSLNPGRINQTTSNHCEIRTCQNGNYGNIKPRRPVTPRHSYYAYVLGLVAPTRFSHRTNDEEWTSGDSERRHAQKENPRTDWIWRIASSKREMMMCNNNNNNLRPLLFLLALAVTPSQSQLTDPSTVQVGDSIWYVQRDADGSTSHQQ